MDRVELIRSLAAGLASLEAAHPLRVAIDGVDASGRARLADELAAAIQQLGRPVIRDAREPAEANAVVIVDDCFLHRPAQDSSISQWPISPILQPCGPS
jgi:hypothetical protein